MALEAQGSNPCIHPVVARSGVLRDIRSYYWELPAGLTQRPWAIAKRLRHGILIPRSAGSNPASPVAQATGRNISGAISSDGRAPDF